MSEDLLRASAAAPAQQHGKDRRQGRSHYPPRQYRNRGAINVANQSKPKPLCVLATVSFAEVSTLTGTVLQCDCLAIGTKNAGLLFSEAVLAVGARDTPQSLITDSFTLPFFFYCLYRLRNGSFFDQGFLSSVQGSLG